MPKNNEDLAINIRVTADQAGTKDLQDQLTKALKEIAGTTTLINIGADTTPAINKFNQLLYKIRDTNIPPITVDLNLDKANNKIEGFYNKLRSRAVGINANVNIDLKGAKEALDTLTEINNIVNNLNKKGAVIKVTNKNIIAGSDIDPSSIKSTSISAPRNIGKVDTTIDVKEEKEEYKSLRQKRNIALTELEKSYQDFGAFANETKAAWKDFIKASADLRKFVLYSGSGSPQAQMAEIRNLMSAYASNDFINNQLQAQYNKIQRDAEKVDRKLNPDKYSYNEAAQFVGKRLQEEAVALAELKNITDYVTTTFKEIANELKATNAKIKSQAQDEITQQKSLNTALKENLRQATSRERTDRYERNTRESVEINKKYRELSDIINNSKLKPQIDYSEVEKFMALLDEYRNLLGKKGAGYRFFDREVFGEKGIALTKDSSLFAEVAKRRAIEYDAYKETQKLLKDFTLEGDLSKAQERERSENERYNTLKRLNNELARNIDLQEKQSKLLEKQAQKDAQQKIQEKKQSLLSELRDVSAQGKRSPTLEIANEQLSKFLSLLEEYRNITNNTKPDFFKKIAEDTNVTQNHPFFDALKTLYLSSQSQKKALDDAWKAPTSQQQNILSEREKIIDKEYNTKKSIADLEKDSIKYREAVLQKEQQIRLALGKKGLSGGILYNDTEYNKINNLIDGAKNVNSQIQELRKNAIEAGLALNKATDPKDIEKLSQKFNSAIDALVKYTRATKGLTSGGEATLIEKLRVDGIYEGSKAYEILTNKMKEAVRLQKELNKQIGRTQDSRDPNNRIELQDWINNLSSGKVLQSLSYAMRGWLNTIQEAGRWLTSLEKVSGFAGQAAKGLSSLLVVVLSVSRVVRGVYDGFVSLTNVLLDVGKAVYSVLQPGVELYKLLETSRLSFAATFSAMSKERGQEISYERGLQIADDLQKRVILDALNSAFSPQELTRALQGTLGIAFAKGLNLEQAYNVVKSTAAVGKSIQLPENQLLQEVRDILQGTLSARSSQVAYAIGMNPEELRAAEEQGRLYEYIIEKMEKYNVALQVFETTFTGAMERFNEAWSIATKEIFSGLAPIIGAIKDEFVKQFIGTQSEDAEGYTEFVDSPIVIVLRDVLQEVGLIIASVADTINEIIKEVLNDTDVIIDLKESFQIWLKVWEELVPYIVTGSRILVKFIKWLGILSEAFILVANASLVIVKILVDAILNLNKYYEIHDALMEFIDNIFNAFGKLFDLDFDGFIEDAEKAFDTFLTKSTEIFGTLADKIYEYFSDLIQKLVKSFFSLSEIVGIKPDFYARWAKRITGHDWTKEIAEWDKNRKGSIRKSAESAINESAQRKAAAQVVASEIEGNKTKTQEDLAKLRKALQAYLEDLKQALKQAIEELRDIAQQNELAYRQGYKSIEDYFTTKAQLEEEEARLRLETAIKERDAVAALDVGTDESAKYQKERDLIRYNSEIATYSREYTKKVNQSNELLERIADNTGKALQRQNVLSSSGADVSKIVESAKNIVASGATYDDLVCTQLVVKSWDAVGLEEALQKAGIDTLNMRNWVPDLVEIAKKLNAWHEAGSGYVPKAGDAGVTGDYDHTFVYIDQNRAANSSGRYGGSTPTEIIEDVKSWYGDTITGYIDINKLLEAARGNLKEVATNEINITNDMKTSSQDALLSAELLRNIGGRKPQAFSELVLQYQNAIEDGEKQVANGLKQYADFLNDPDFSLNVVISDIVQKYKKSIEVARTKYANVYPELAGILENVMSIDYIKQEADMLDKVAKQRVEVLKKNALALDKQFREKTMIVQDGIERYFDHFFNSDSPFSPMKQIQRMEELLREAERRGATTTVYMDITNKLNNLQQELANIIKGWIDEASNYFNYERSMIDADSGLTDFVKEGHKQALDKGEARWKAVAYRQQAIMWAERENKYQEEYNRLKAEGNNLGAQANYDAMVQAERLKTIAERQADINEKLGEQKTLWQEAMDVANQALEKGLFNFLTDGINSVIEGTKSLKQAFIEMLTSILKEIQAFFAKQLVKNFMSVLLGKPQQDYVAPTEPIGNNPISSLNNVNPIQAQNVVIQAQNVTEGMPKDDFSNMNTTLGIPPEQQGLTPTAIPSPLSGKGGTLESGTLGDSPTLNKLSSIETAVQNTAQSTQQLDSNMGSLQNSLSSATNSTDVMESQIPSLLQQLIQLTQQIPNEISMVGQQITSQLQGIDNTLFTIDNTLQQINSNLSMAGGNFGPATKSGSGFATGGYISGPGTSTSDSIPAMLSNGEFVIKAEAVKRYGTNFLNAVNNGHFTKMKTTIPRFADGGYVGTAEETAQTTARGISEFAKTIGTNVTTQNKLNIAMVRDENEAMRHFLQSGEGQRILVDFNRKNRGIFNSIS